MSEKSSKKIPGWLKWLLFAIFIIIIIMIIWLIFRPKESHTSSNVAGEKIILLKCKSENPEDAFFETFSAKESTHEIRATFKDDKIDKISYIFEAKYDSLKAAEAANASLHGQYNKYMGEYGLSEQSLNPNFAVIDDSIKIYLDTDKKNINHSTSQFFFLNSDEFQRFSSRNSEELKQIYENKDFSCEIHK